MYLNDKASLDDVKSAVGIKDDSETLTIQQQQALGFREYSKVRNFNHFITASNIWKSTDKKTSVDSWLEVHPEADMKGGPDTEESIGKPKEEKDTTKKKKHRGLFGRWLNTGEDFLGKIFGKKKKKEEKQEAGKPAESKPVKEEPKVALYKKYGLDKLFGEKLASKEEIENVVDKLHLEFDPLGNVKGIEIPDDLKITDFNDPEKYLKQYKQMQGYFDFGGKEPEVEQKAGTVANKDVKIDKPIIPDEDKNTDVVKPITSVVGKIDEMKPGEREIVEMEESKIKEKVERESDIWIRIERLLTQIADNTKGIDSGFDKISKVSGSNIVYSKTYNNNRKENSKNKETGNVIVPIVNNSGNNTDAMNINNLDQEMMKINNQYYNQMKNVASGGNFTTHNMF